MVLQAILRWAGADVPYDHLVGALGLSLLTTSTGRHDDCVGDWPAYGRDFALPEAAELYGLRLRAMHPPEAAKGLSDSPEFAKHFADSYRPLVLQAVDNRQPVLAWQGWPDSQRLMWGVITESSDQGVGLAGTTSRSDGRTVPLVRPPVQLYVVEEVSPRQPADEALLDCTLTAGRRALDGTFTNHRGVVAGSAAFDQWIARLSGEPTCPACGHGDAACHHHLARSLAHARESAGRFFENMGDRTGSSRWPLPAQLAAHCRRAVDWLKAAPDEKAVDGHLSNQQGRRVLADSIRALQAAERYLAALLNGLDSHSENQPEAQA